MKQLFPGIFQWSWFSEEKKIDFNGLFLTVGEHRVLVDPPPMTADDLNQIRRGGQVDYILITNRDHVRETVRYQQEFRCQVLVPDVDEREMEIKADKTFGDGALLPGGMWIVHLKDQKAPGESALFLQQGKGIMIVGDALIGRPPGRRALLATLGNLGNICAVSGRRDQAQTRYQEVLELQKILGDEQGIGTTLANLGNLRADAAEWERARAYYLEALDIMERTGDDPGLAVLYSDLGLVARETGQYDDATRCYEQSLSLMRRTGNQGGMADAWRMMGRTYVMQKRYEEALACCRTSLAVAERGGDELRAGGARYVMAQCYEEIGWHEEAADLLEWVVRMDRKYRLPKLEENSRRLEALRARLAADEGGRACDKETRA